MRKFIKLGEDRYLVKDSNGIIVSKKEVAEEDIISNERVKDMVKNGDNTVKKTKRTKRTNSKTKSAGDWCIRFNAERKDI